MNQGKRRGFVFLTAFLLLGVIPTIAQATETSINQWKAVMNSRDKALVFDVLNGPTSIWPRVHSLEMSSHLTGIDQQEQSEFLSIAHDVVHDSKVLLAEMPRHTSAENWKRLDSALNIRDNMLHNPGYVNLVLADCLHRLCIVSLCKELGAEKQVSPEFEKALSGLMMYGVSVDQWVTLTKEELGWSDEKLKEVTSCSDSCLALHNLWDLLTDGDNFEFPKNLGNSFTHDLLRKRDISMLLYRYVYNDIMLKKLSLAVQYKKQAEDFSLNDRSEKVARVLPGSGDGKRISIVTTGGVPRVVITTPPVDVTKLSFGERFLNIRLSAYNIVSLLHMIQYENINLFMMFDSADVESELKGLAFPH